MIDYGLNNKVVLITGVNNPQGIGATTAIAFAQEGAKLVLVYKKVFRPFDKSKSDKNGVDRYYAALLVEKIKNGNTAVFGYSVLCSEYLSDRV